MGPAPGPRPAQNGRTRRGAAQTLTRALIRLVAHVHAVVFGAPGGGLKELQASLEAARCAVAALHTAWPPADALSAALLGGGKQQQEEQEEEGVRVKLVYLTRDLTALELPAGLLAGPLGLRAFRMVRA